MSENGKEKTGVIPNTSLFTLKLIELLKASKIGETLTDEQMTAACGRKTAVGEPGYANLATAIRHCVRHYGVVWLRIKGARAIKCLSAGEVIDSSKADLEQVHRRAKRSMRKLQTVDEKQLDNGQGVAFRTLVAQHGTLVMFSSDRARKALEVRKVSGPPALENLLGSFK